LEKEKLDADLYLEQFHNHHHHKQESIGRRKWHENAQPKQDNLKPVDLETEFKIRRHYG
jgi:hypothetical protein